MIQDTIRQHATKTLKRDFVSVYTHIRRGAPPPPPVPSCMCFG